MKIYTRHGDGGETQLLGKNHVPKDQARVEALGTIDELNACLGLVIASLAMPDKQALAAVLERVQGELFSLGAAVGTAPGANPVAARGVALPANAVEVMEGEIDGWTAALPALTGFVLPGGGLAAAHAHFARTVCRRAERIAVRLARAGSIPEGALIYLNRLSDWLFTLARFIAQAEGHADVLWRKP